MKLFSKNRTTNFGISKDFYLTIFCPQSSLPPLRELIAHRSMARAVLGMGTPLAAMESEDVIGEPLRRGAYACVTMNRKTVVRMLVMRRDECTVDIDALAAEKDQVGLDQELISRIQAAWFLAQLSYESYDPQAFASIRFLYRLADRLAELTEGVIADPLAERYLKPGTWYRESHDEAPIDPLELVTVSEVPGPNGPRLMTAGMKKLDLPEYAVDLGSREHRRHGHEVIVESVRDLLNQARKGKHPSHAAVLHPFTAVPAPEREDLLFIRPHRPTLDFISAHQEWKDRREAYN